jgi:hypothetical protein
VLRQSNGNDSGVIPAKRSVADSSLLIRLYLNDSAWSNTHPDKASVNAREP